MPMRADERVTLVIGDNAHDDWESYDIDSDLLTPADAWHVTLGMGQRALPYSVKPGAAVEVRVGDDLVMVGHVDEVGRGTAKRGRDLSLSGRDGAAVLVDCSAPIFTAKMSSLDEICAKIVRPLGITKIRIDAEKTRVREKINVEPGDTAWAVLSNVAEANGLWPWFDPDGTLVIGGPDYTTTPVASLVMRYSGRGNNVISFSLRESIQGRYSHLTVLGQTHGTNLECGKHDIRGGATDSGVPWYRPHVVVDHESDTVAVAEDRARKLLADSRLKAFTLAAVVKGHRISAPGQYADGELWAPGQRVHVFSDPDQLDGIFFVMGRKFTGGKDQEPETHLTLKEDGAWVLDAHPHKRKHRRGKNDAAGQIVDVSNKP